ncbi:MAG: MFS transporter [Bacteroidetes bacterium HGW-Bacteroidetes-4]|jgi:sugar porter (SP) family MFS transporter|nr:MAG: MFS transporter [Bacteroidetes bacterium HGW-Bacteroidetes-4]
MATKNKSAYTFLIALIVALGGFLMGFDASVISGVVGFIEPEFELTKLQLGWAVSCLTLTSTLGMVIAGPLSDKIGRRKVLIYASVLFFISALYSAMAPGFVHLVTARMIGGFGVGAALIIAPMYIAEIAPPKKRGRMVSLNQLNIVLGISVAFFTNYLILQFAKSDAAWTKALMFNEFNWRWMLGLEALPAILYFVGMFFVPESPRWLAMHQQPEQALSVMTRLMGSDEAKNELNTINQSINQSKHKEKVPLSELFKPAMKLVLTIGIVIAILQQITGINSVFFYAPMIFEQTGIGTDASFVQAIIIGLTNLVFTIVAMLFVDRLGRKPLLGFGIAGIVISMFVLAGSFKAAEYKLTADAISQLENVEGYELLTKIEGTVFTSDVEFKDALNELLGSQVAAKHQGAIISSSITINPWLVLFGIVGFVASFAVSLGPVMWILFSELFPNRLRGLAISFAGFINSGVSFLVQLMLPWELSNIGNAGTFFIYGLFGAVGLVFILIYLPETKNKSLEDLEKILIKE